MPPETLSQPEIAAASRQEVSIHFIGNWNKQSGNNIALEKTVETGLGTARPEKLIGQAETVSWYVTTDKPETIPETSPNLHFHSRISQKRRVLGTKLL